MPDGTRTAHFFRPKLATVFSEGYHFTDLRKDVLAAFTVAIVALPLSMAIAVGSGVSPDRGLYAAIVGGFLVSALGGSRFQIGGPAGAFIVLVAATVGKFGVDGLLLTVLISGLMLVAIALLRLGTLIRHIPHAVAVGFTCGIAITILASQLKDFAGLKLGRPEPGLLLPKLGALLQVLPTINPFAFAIGFASVIFILLLRHFRPAWPGMIIAVVAASAAVTMLHLPVETIGSRFGGLPNGIPLPHVPHVTFSLLMQILPAAISFTLLGGLESLLSAKVADGMTGRVHRSNMELLAQGLANVASALFGGISVTGTIARTATNVRAGARSPLAGILHSVFLLLFILIAGRLASYVPLSALSGVLIVVCWNMAEKGEFVRLLGSWRPAVILIVTFGLTLLKDLTCGIFAGCLIAAIFALLDRSEIDKAA